MGFKKKRFWSRDGETCRTDSNVRPHSWGTKAQTRELLIRATLELLHSGGEDAVTTVSVTRAAAVVQSMFYHHLVNVEECLAVAAEQTTPQAAQ